MTDRLIAAGVMASGGVVAGCILSVIGVVRDLVVLEVVGAILIVVGFIVMAVGIVAALISRKWVKALIGIGAVVACIVLCLLAGIMIGAGQHHAPKEMEVADVDYSGIFTNGTSYSELVGTDIEHDSWWTDGTTYYRVQQSGDTYLLKGGTMHEGGYEAAFRVTNDTLWTALAPNGDNTFAPEGLMVRHYLIDVWNPDSTRIELLAAFNGAYAEATPVAVLQRFNGHEAHYELAGIHALLAGTYSNDQEQWTFTTDGKVALSPDASPQPYQIEQFYHAHTNVLKLPDGRHVALEVDDTEMKVMEAAYDKEEEGWTGAAQPQKILLELQRQDDDGEAALLLKEKMLITKQMLPFLKGDMEAICLQLASLGSHEHIIAQFNYYLLQQWKRQAEEWDNDLAEDADENE